MTRKEIFDKVRAVVAEASTKDIDDIGWTTNFGDDVGLDSLDLVELVMKLEETMGVKVSDEEAEKLTNIESTVDFIEAKLAVSQET